MKFDFESIIDRRGKDALAVDNIEMNDGFPENLDMGEFDLIPMWVADMNFAVAPSIQEAIIERVKHPTFGYFVAPDKYYDSIISWQERRNHVQNLDKDCIGHENGVLGGVLSAIRAFAAPGEAVLVHSPTYVGFTSCIERCGYKIIHSPLKRDKDNIWRMDYEDMDKKIKEHAINVAVMCNPHNPTGRVWEKEELKKAMQVFENNSCMVVSDEIWSDIILEGYSHTPLQSVSEYARKHTVALYSISKTFNLAGLVGSYHIIYDEYVRNRVRAYGERAIYNELNVLSMHAMIGAYQKEGEEWVEELRTVIAKNVNYACDYINEQFEGVEVSKPQGTYMLFMDCTKWCEENGKTLDELLLAGWKVGVIWQDGRPFFGENCIRLNLALPLSRVQEAFERLGKYVF